MSAEAVADLVANIRALHQPIPEGSGGTGGVEDQHWNGPCRADLQMWPCYAAQAADMLERQAESARIFGSLFEIDASPHPSDTLDMRR